MKKTFSIDEISRWSPLKPGFVLNTYRATNENPGVAASGVKEI